MVEDATKYTKQIFLQNCFSKTVYVVKTMKRLRQETGEKKKKGKELMSSVFDYKTGDGTAFIF